MPYILVTLIISQILNKLGIDVTPLQKYIAIYFDSINYYNILK
jgi:hypothetical protein